MKRILLPVLALLALLLAGGSTVGAQPAATQSMAAVDFRYAPPWWQTAICLPDDPDKTLVGKEGQLLFDYGRQHGFRDFGICIQPDMAGGVAWQRQATLSPRVPIVQTWKRSAGGVEVLEQTFVIPAYGAQQVNMPTPPARVAVLLVLMKNAGPAEATCQPVLRIQSVDPVAFDTVQGCVAIGTQTVVMVSEPVVTAGPTSNKVFTIELASRKLQPGQSHQAAFFISRHVKPVANLAGMDEAVKQREAARTWWETAGLPFDTLRVPDPGIQGMLESCVRNIWQAREIKNGQPAFHVGPTCYRGLWVVDGAFLLESAALVGRAKDARAGIEYLLSHQKPDGSFEIIGRYWKENGIVLWTVTRHALLTQDKAWLEAVWPKLERTVAAIRHLRERSRTDPPELDDGLMPAGFPDGGIGGNHPEYSNVYWNLAGLKAAIGAAAWLDKKEQAAQWGKEYDDFMATFRKTAERDMATDPHGNRYLPTIMGAAGKKELPQRGQWAFLHAVYPGQIFAKDDALVQGNLAMLRATKQQGLVFGTGWDAEGLWTYAASFYGHAALWQGQGREAAQVLYDYANHACPTRVWREEQRPVGKGGHEVGDMPHNWASAEFIRLATHLLELDRGDELHLLEGLPSQWLGPGMVTKLNGVATPFGPLFMTLEVAADGKTATLALKPLGANCRAVLVHAPDGSTKPMDPQQGGTVTFPVGPAKEE